MDPAIDTAIIHWRARWVKVNNRLRRAAQQNEGDFPRLTHAHQEGVEFLALTLDLSSILPQVEVLWALRLVRHLLVQVQEALDRPDTTVTHHANVLTWVSSGGRPRIVIDRAFLDTALKLENATQIGKRLGICRKAVRREALRHGLVDPGAPVFEIVRHDDGSEELIYHRPQRDQCPWTNAELDEHVRYALKIFPRFGRLLMRSFLLVTCNMVVPWPRLRESLCRCAPQRYLGDRAKIKRRVYRVAGPNALWHIDAQLGMRRYGVVLHGIADGNSRLCPGLRASSNNKKETFFCLFSCACLEYGTPSRVRGDHGKENLAIAAFMEMKRGLDRGSFLWGKSVHNIRIERMWVDVTNGFGRKWKAIFLQFELEAGLDVNNDAHLWLLHHLFLDFINRDANLWRACWNRHTFSRLPGGQKTTSPAALWYFGMVENGVRGIDDDEMWGREPEDPVFGEEGPNNYGVDWEDIDDARVREHHMANHPETMAEVVVDDPKCPLLQHEISWVNRVVAATDKAVELNDLLRRWHTGLEAMNRILESRAPM